MKIIPIHPDDVSTAAAPGATGVSLARRTLAARRPGSRRTLGARLPSRRTLGGRIPSRRTLARTR